MDDIELRVWYGPEHAPSGGSMATAMLRCDVPSEHMSTQCMRVRSVALWCIPHEWRYQTPPSTVHARSHVLRCVASGGSVPEAIVSLDGGVCICGMCACV